MLLYVRQGVFKVRLFNTPDLTLAKTLEICQPEAVVTKQVLQIQQTADKKVIIKQEPRVDIVQRRNAQFKGKIDCNFDINRFRLSKSVCQYCGSLMVTVQSVQYIEVRLYPIVLKVDTGTACCSIGLPQLKNRFELQAPY